MATVSEKLTEQFYRWELRGRGWQVFDTPVAPEPQFRPFLGHYLSPEPQIDDGRRPTALSSFWERLTGGPQPQPLPAPSEEEEGPAPEALPDREGLIELQAVLPAELDIPREAFEEFLGSLHLCQEPVAFEILGLPGSGRRAQFVAHPKDAPLVHQQLKAFFPDASFLLERGSLEKGLGRRGMGLGRVRAGQGIHAAPGLGPA